MKYIPTIGLELHTELKTKNKVFSRSENSFNEIPNTNISPLDLGLPGTLPVVNKEAVKKSIKMALCLNCNIPNELLFDRKNYYYPDLPKGYQITQTTNPIGTNGKLIVDNNGNDFEVFKIHDIHLEEDTASLDHYYDYSLLDYNRCGVPLLEIVTEPCIHSAEDALSYLEYLINILRYCDISEADTKKGQIRCDVNVSLSKDNTLGTRVEMKNINSLNGIYNSILFEVERQTKLLDEGKEVLQETRRYDIDTNTSFKMRSKEDAIDYKYFVEPNIPVISLDSNWIKSIKKEIPILPYERKKKYVSEYNINDKDASIIVKDLYLANYFEECISLGISPKQALNWLLSEILGVLNKELISVKDFFFTPLMLKTILDKMNKGEISSKQAKKVFNKSIEEKIDPKELLNNFTQLSDENELEKIIDIILSNKEEQITAYKNGRTNLFDFFVGQVMKETKGKANPSLTKDILNRKLN